MVEPNASLHIVYIGDRIVYMRVCECVSVSV